MSESTSVNAVMCMHAGLGLQQHEEVDAGRYHTISSLLQATEGVCPVCSKAFDAEAKVPINGTSEQVSSGAKRFCAISICALLTCGCSGAEGVQLFLQVERLRQLLPSRQPLKLKGKKRKVPAIQQESEGLQLQAPTAKLARRLIPTS